MCLSRMHAYVQSLGETSKMHLTKRERRDLVNQQTKKNRAEHTVKSASEYFNSTKLDIAVLKKPLTRENYREKFHHLLCWEEKEHSKILSERYTISFTFYCTVTTIETYLLAQYYFSLKRIRCFNIIQLCMHGVLIHAAI